MGCGCGSKKVRRTVATARTERYGTNGGQNMVKLGLKSGYSLPIKLPNAIDGRDVIVVASNKHVPAARNAIIVFGRDAWIKSEFREKLVARWPHVFEYE